MSEEQDFLSVGYHKGEMDFGVNSSVIKLSYEEMGELRKMIVVAIGTMEDMWRREREKNFPQAENKRSTNSISNV